MTIEKAVSEEYITIYRPFITVKGKRIFARQKAWQPFLSKFLPLSIEDNLC